MNKEITLQRDNYSKENGRIAFSDFRLPPEVRTVKEVRRESSNRRITEFHFDKPFLSFRGNCEKIICKVWWDDEVIDEFAEHQFFLKMVKEGKVHPFDKHKKGFRKRLLKLMESENSA